MKWFEGSINEAVTTSKSRKAIFVVFIEGKDNESVQFAKAIDTPDVSSRLEQDEFVAIRIEHDSETYRFFQQIYQLVPVPSIFFIGENGTPLEIVFGNTTSSDLLSKIDRVLEKAGKKGKDASLNLINAEQNAAAASSSSTPDDVTTASAVATESTEKINTESVPKLPEEVEPAVNNESLNKNDTKEEDSTTTQNDQPTTETPATKVEEPKDLSPEEKLERAKQLIEVQRRQRIEDEERKQKEKEVERRKVGRDVQKLRQRQQELEIKQAQEERMREKAAEAALRETVKRRIEQDKLERKQMALAFQQEQQKKQVPEQPRPYVPMAHDASVTRIQFRLPTGNPHMAQFEPTNTLGALRSYVAKNIELPFQQFSMSISFPRRDLTPEDDNKTLLELELVPTAVILILPLKNTSPPMAVSPPGNAGFLTRFIMFFYAQFVDHCNRIIGFFWRDPQRNTVQEQRETNSRDTTNNAEEPMAPNPQNIAQAARYLRSQGGARIRAEGNIHRLHSGGDDNDENNTWNGNSTQQM